MEKGDIFSVVLCITNTVFMVAGISLNSVVIISLWRSRQLRKKLCYFMILVLSCVDLAVVTITHPLLIASTIYYSLQEINKIRETSRESICFILYGVSIFAIFTLNVERFLTLTCPFFHHASVTKTRLVYFQALVTIIIVGLSPLYYFKLNTIANILVALYLSLLLFLFICSNYKMFTIAKSKRADRRVAPVTAASSTDEKRQKQILNVKNISTCSLAVGCFLVCSCPQIIYSALHLASGELSYDRKIVFILWSNTLLSMNSTFNCVIFFWRNSILRREGIKIINALRVRIIN